MTLRIEVDAPYYYNSLRFKCPSCGAVSTVSADETTARGSDFLLDACEPCGMTILIDNSDQTVERGKVGFTAYSSVAEAVMAMTQQGQ